MTLTEANAELDAFFSPPERPELEEPRAYARARLAWRVARRAARQSSQSLPAVSLAAQHAVAAREHAQSAIDALAGATTGEQPPEEP